MTDPTNISNVFSDFYSGLYTSESNALDWEEPNPLDSLAHPWVGEDAATSLGALLTVLEITETIRALQSGKSPGPDGYTTDFNIWWHVSPNFGASL